MRTFSITKTGLLLAATIVLQLAGLPQPVTGPVVNMMLYISTLAVGIGGAVIIGCLTPIVAFTRGILPPPLAPAIPFIALGNALLSVVYGVLYPRSRLLAILAASLFKYLLLAGAVRFVIQVPPGAAVALQAPQLLTALGGGALAWLLHNPLKGAGIIDED